MEFETIKVAEIVGGLTITINRPDQKNSINNQLLNEIHMALDLAEQDENCRIIGLGGQSGVFCTGMDFNQIDDEEMVQVEQGNRLYLDTLKRFTRIPKIVVALVEGQAMAGGIGLVAASPESQFSLSEALWGLLPAMVTPYLIRRVGFQLAYRMTFSTMPITAQEAFDAHLVDEINRSPNESLRRLWLRLSKLKESTIKNLKEYFNKMWFLTQEMEEMAVAETSRLSSDPAVVQGIKDFVQFNRFPWES